MAFYHEMITAFWQILKSPFVDISVIWLIAPIILIWIVLEAYFSTHKKEKLGWNTALGNGISMFWITVQLMQFLFRNKFENFDWMKFSVVLLIIMYSLFVAYISFTHKFSSTVTYAIASPTPVYFWSLVAIMWSYGSLSLSLWVFVDILLLFVIVLSIIKILHKFAPESEKDTEDDEDNGKLDFGSGGNSDFGSGSSGKDDLFGSDDFTKEGESFGGGNDPLADLKL